MSETFVEVAKGVRVRVTDDGRGQVAYKLQYEFIGQWFDAKEGVVVHFYNLAGVAPPGMDLAA